MLKLTHKASRGILLGLSQMIISDVIEHQSRIVFPYRALSQMVFYFRFKRFSQDYLKWYFLSC